MKQAIQDFLTDQLSFLPPEAVVVMISAVPVLELRAGIPLAHLYGFSFTKALLLGILGNLLPIIPILLLFRPVSGWLLRFNWYKSFYNWLYRRTLSKGDKVQKFGAVALILFTAVPIPTTGAYSACAAATFFTIRLRYAIAAIAFGVVLAGLIVAGAMYTIFR